MPMADRIPRLREEFSAAHDEVRRELPRISRIAVAIYDPPMDRFTTFAHSTAGRTPFTLHEARLADVPSLADFVSFDSQWPAYFTPPVVTHLTVHAHLVALLVPNALRPAQLLRAAIDVAPEMSSARDQETGAHLDRMARYARLIGREVAAREGRDDGLIEFVFLFAPLHGLGKVAIPDRILPKEGPLAEEEAERMHSHVDRGLELVEWLAEAFGIAGSEHVEILRKIVAAHHEAWDGCGYPRGLAGHEISREARITAVADVFDDPTSARPYKRAWTNDEAFAYFEDLAGQRFDAGCVRALVTRRDEVEAIRHRFGGEDDRLASLHEAYLETIWAGPGGGSSAPVSRPAAHQAPAASSTPG